VILSHSIPSSGISPERLVHWAAAASRHDSGDPLDSALTEAAPETIAIERLASFPFTEDRRRETAIIRRGDGVRMAVVKGAPETVFQLCELDVPSVEFWRAQVSTYASTGHKVIAAATRILAEAERSDSEPENGYMLVGLLALEDPIREGVREAVAACREAGIKVMMVTGDHPDTAEAVARDIGLGAGQPNVVLADAMNFAESGESRGTLAGIDAVARATPSQKVALVSALKRSGETVAVTGDGVNDVPALQIADVGIAMGERGTQSAREVAAMVLLDDNFRTIVRAIAEGRQLFLNLQLAFAYLLLVHIPLVVSAAVVPLLGGPLLYLPIHIIWLELIIHPTALLVFQEMPSTARLLPTKRGAASRFFDVPTWALIGVSGLAQAAIISVGFELALEPTSDVAHARSISLGILIGSSAATTGVLSGLRGWPAKLIVGGSLASFFLLVQIPLFAELVHLSPLHLADWLIVAAAMLAVVLLTLAVKVLIGRDRHTNQSASR
jgi:Ca2+-transporting ATPase